MKTVLRLTCATVMFALLGCEVAYDDDEALPPPSTAPGAADGIERSETPATDLEGATGSAIDAAERRSGSTLGQARDAANRTIGAVEERSRQIAGDEP